MRITYFVSQIVQGEHLNSHSPCLVSLRKLYQELVCILVAFLVEFDRSSLVKLSDEREIGLYCKLVRI